MWSAKANLAVRALSVKMKLNQGEPLGSHGSDPKIDNFCEEVFAVEQSRVSGDQRKLATVDTGRKKQTSRFVNAVPYPVDTAQHLILHTLQRSPCFA